MVDLKHDNSAEAPHEGLVREYLATELEPQAGRAEAKFRQMLAQRGSAVSQTARRGWGFPNRFTGWSLGLVGTALAASLGALWAGPSLRQAAPTTPGTNVPMVQRPQVINPIYVEQRTDSQMFDDGTFMTPDNTPIRVLHRRDMERTRWFDKDQKLTGEQVVPEDHVVYVKLKTY
jgi:hypothetical protein